MAKEILIIVDESQERIDRYLARKLGKTRNQIKNLILDQKILLNNHPVKVKYKINKGEKISVTFPKPAPSHLIPQKIDLEILHEDEDIIVINKQNNIVVHPAPGHREKTLVHGLLNHCSNLSGISGIQRPGVVHRLDKKTTGVIVFAKNDQAYQVLCQQFQEHTSCKIYHALVHGVMKHQAGKIDAPIGRASNDRKKYVVTNKNSKQAITYFKVLQQFSNYAYLEIKIITGRTHQIRVHMNFINHPIVGDEVYGYKKKSSTYGQYLHAYSLEFIHPKTSKKVVFCANLPQEFSKKLNQLAKLINNN